jgi:ribosomal protein S18 acetylase RimI-like enzyme
VIELRDAVLDDYVTLTRLWAHMDRLHAALLPGFFRVPPPPGRTREQVERLLRTPDEALRVAILDDAARGLCHAQVYDTPPLPALTPCRRVHLDSLVVDPAVRRRGVGRRLVEDAGAWGRVHDAAEVVLTVWAGNEEAERFYEALGFGRVNAVLGRKLV